MEAPFIYGKIATNKYFTNRKEELQKLLFNFLAQVNTTLISPRRWGKSSLVIKAAQLAKKENKLIQFIFIDLFNVRNEEEFYQLMAKEVLKISASKADGILNNAKSFLSRLTPKISFSPDNQTDFSISFDWEETKKRPDDILNLVENIATKKKIKLVLCIDEFQNISSFEDSLAFQKKLRAHWQIHKNVSYCLYGSKRHMLLDVFSSYSMPFYKFGEIIYLQKIKEIHWIPFIQKRFEATNKKIARDVAANIAKLVEYHPYYVQQLAQQAWLRTSTGCSHEIVSEAFESLTLQLSMLFQTLTDDLSSTQVYFLKALNNEVKQLSSKNTIQKFKLGTSSNVIRIKQALTNKEILDIQGKNIEFLDPVYKYWLKKYYFKEQLI